MKLQPNFSWQKYQGKAEDAAEQFQYRLQQEHVIVANSINATIDDSSFFLQERRTSFSWVDDTLIFNKTIPTSAWTSGGTVNTIALGLVPGRLGNVTVINMVCCISNGTLPTSTTLLMPYLDQTYGTASISMVRSGQNIVLTSAGTNYSTYSGFVTIYYVKS